MHLWGGLIILLQYLLTSSCNFHVKLSPLIIIILEMYYYHYWWQTLHNTPCFLHFVPWIFRHYHRRTTTFRRNENTWRNTDVLDTQGRRPRFRWYIYRLSSGLKEASVGQLDRSQLHKHVGLWISTRATVLHSGSVHPSTCRLDSEYSTMDIKLASSSSSIWQNNASQGENYYGEKKARQIHKSTVNA